MWQSHVVSHISSTDATEINFNYFFISFRNNFIYFIASYEELVPEQEKRDVSSMAILVCPKSAGNDALAVVVCPHVRNPVIWGFPIPLLRHSLPLVLNFLHFEQICTILVPICIVTGFQYLLYLIQFKFYKLLIAAKNAISFSPIHSPLMSCSSQL